jgi:hypothetical protein
MAQFAPHYNLSTIAAQLRTGTSYLFWIIFGLSIVPLILKFTNVQIPLNDLINTVNIIALASFFGLEIVANSILMPLADSKRRDDFLDNSFGSQFSTTPSVGYYDNEDVQQGVYKAACNLFENSFFSLNLVKAVTVKKIVVPVIVLLVVLTCAYYGFKQIPNALSMLQALFSATLLGGLANHIILLIRLHVIHDNCINLFQKPDLKPNVVLYQTYIYRYWLQYECLHSRINFGIPEKTFLKHNPALTKAWKDIKIKYHIN